MRQSVAGQLVRARPAAGSRRVAAAMLSMRGCLAAVSVLASCTSSLESATVADFSGHASIDAVASTSGDVADVITSDDLEVEEDPTTAGDAFAETSDDPADAGLPSEPISSTSLCAWTEENWPLQPTRQTSAVIGSDGGVACLGLGAVLFRPETVLRAGPVTMGASGLEFYDGGYLSPIVSPIWHAPETEIERPSMLATASDSIFEIEILASDPNDPRNDSALVFSARVGQSPLTGVPLAQPDFVRTEVGWRVRTGYVNWIWAGTAEAPRCGDGIVDPWEECDDGGLSDQTRRGCNFECLIEWGYKCTGEPSVCRRSCLPATCARYGTDHPCRAGVCDDLTDACTVVPANEAERCTLEDIDGWCHGGECVPEPRRCNLCGDGQRWVDGACRDEEVHYLGSARYDTAIIGGNPARVSVSDSLSEHFVHMHPGAYYCGGVPGLHQGRSIDMPDGVRDAFDARDISPYFQLTHRHRSSLVTPDGVPYAWERFSLEPGPDWELALELPEGYDFVVSGFRPGNGAHNMYSWAREFYPWVSDECFGFGYFVGAYKFSETESPLCEVAVDVDGDWQLCAAEPGWQQCGGECVNTLIESEHCGGCGVQCDFWLEACVDGECRCHPAIEQTNPASCSGCPPGWGGFDCDRPCPGLDEATGIGCNGVGRCYDGPRGNLTCTCDRPYHGLACEFSCTDGVRNGAERGVDCGGQCAACGAL